jgi:hypothetical protein
MKQHGRNGLGDLYNLQAALATEAPRDMKDVKLLDILPSIFGLIAVAGALTPGLWGDVGLGPMMLYGSGIVTFVTALTSFAARDRKFQTMHYVNAAWLVLILLFLTWTMIVVMNWHMFMGR